MADLTEKQMDKRERAKERREKRRQEISLLRSIPYSEHQRYASDRLYTMGIARKLLSMGPNFDVLKVYLVIEICCCMYTKFIFGG